MTNKNKQFSFNMNFILFLIRLSLSLSLPFLLQTTQCEGAIKKFNEYSRNKMPIKGLELNSRSDKTIVR